MLAPETDIILRAEGLGKQVSSGNSLLHILDNIDLTVHAGESIAIIGASGSGKSTLLGLLAGLDRPTQGRVILNQHDLSVLDEDTCAKIRSESVGFVFQSFQLLPSLTALENAMLPLELKNKASALQDAKALLSRMGLANRYHHYPRQLSGGEQQRVALARAFITAPSILFADEVTGNLDTETGNHIIQQLFELNQSFNTTLILVTHDQEIANRCHRLVHLKNGRLYP